MIHISFSHLSDSYSTFVYIDDVEYKPNFNQTGESCLPDTLPRRSLYDQDFDRNVYSLTPAHSARLDFLPLAQLIGVHLCFRSRMTRNQSRPLTNFSASPIIPRAPTPCLTALFPRACRVSSPPPPPTSQKLPRPSSKFSATVVN